MPKFANKLSMYGSTSRGRCPQSGAVYLACVMLNRGRGEAARVIAAKTGGEVPEELPEYEITDEDLSAKAPTGQVEPLDVQKRVEGLLHEYADEFRQLQILIVGEAPRRASRRMYWALGILGLVLLVAFVVALLRPESDVERAARLREANLCIVHQTAVMRSIERYTCEHGGPPPTLEALRPGYLAEPPVDPVSGLPYLYSVRGDVIRLSCPKHPLPQHPSR